MASLILWFLWAYGLDGFVVLDLQPCWICGLGFVAWSLWLRWFCAPDGFVASMGFMTLFNLWSLWFCSLGGSAVLKDLWPRRFCGLCEFVALCIRALDGFVTWVCGLRGFVASFLLWPRCVCNLIGFVALLDLRL